MKKPELVIMAAGMGSRYGGLKQIDPVDEQGHVLMDFSIYDAKAAGFETVVFIITREMEEEFHQRIGDRISRLMNVRYAYQDLHNIPAGETLPEGRTKPWGTAQAILSIKGIVDGPFAVVNADDFYGREAFQVLYDYLLHHQDDEICHYSMVGYLLRNTVTENGYVSRGVCEIDENSYLQKVTERTHIEVRGDQIVYLEDDAAYPLDKNCQVSMNLWGFNHSILGEIEDRFRDFFDHEVPVNPMKSEYFLPSVVSDMLDEKKADVKVLTSSDKWYGVTYKEDKAPVMAAIREMKESGRYPEQLWEEE